MIHSQIHREQLSGIINSDSDLPRMKNHFIHLMNSTMMDRGYVPVLDLAVAFSTSYLDEHYEFLLTMYFVKVGKKEAKKWAGMTNQLLVPRSTPPPMSKT